MANTGSETGFEAGIVLPVVSFNVQYFWMTLKLIKALNENSAKYSGENKISFKYGFIDLACEGNFCWFFKNKTSN